MDLFFYVKTVPLASKRGNANFDNLAVENICRILLTELDILSRIYIDNKLNYLKY